VPAEFKSLVQASCKPKFMIFLVSLKFTIRYQFYRKVSVKE